MKIRNKVGYLGAMVLLMTGCGSSDDTTSTSVPTMTVSTTVSAPSAGSASLSKGASVIKADAPKEGLYCHVYNLDGELLGSGTTDANGKVSIANIDLAKAKPDDASGTSWTAELVVIATNDDGSDGDIDDDATVVMESYKEATVDESNPGIITVDADTESTLAAQELRKQAGCAEWAKGCKSGIKSKGIDPFCFFKAQEQIWNDCDASNGTGVEDDCGIMKEMYRSAMIGGVKPADLGYNDLPAMYEAMSAGTMPVAAQSVLAGHVQTYASVPSATVLSNYSTSASAITALNNVVGSQLAGGVGVTTVVASLGKGQTAAEGTACDIIRDSSDDTYIDKLIGTFTSSADVAEINNLWSDADAMKIVFGQMEKYRDAGTMADFQPEVMSGYMAGLTPAEMDNYFQADGTFDSTQLNGMYQVLGSFDPAKVTGYDGVRDWGRSMEGFVAATDGGFNGLMSGGAIDTGRIEFFASYCEGQVGANFDPTAINFDNLENQLYTTYQQVGPSAPSGCTGTFEQCYSAPPPPPSSFEYTPEQQQQQMQTQQQSYQGFACPVGNECGPLGTCSAGFCSYPN